MKLFRSVARSSIAIPLCLDYIFVEATGLLLLSPLFLSAYALLHDIVSNGSLEAEFARLHHSSSDCCPYLL